MSVTTSTTDDVQLGVHEHTDARKSATLSAKEKRVRKTRSSWLKEPGRLFSMVPPLILGVILLVGWYLGTTSGHTTSFFLPAPGDVFSTLLDGIRSGIYFSNVLVTMQESMGGFLLALIVALPLGYAVAKSRLLAAIIQPYLSAGQAIPALVIAPLLIIWLGYGILPNIIICMLVVVFPMVINTVLGIRTIDHSLTDAARVEGAAGWSLLIHVEFPLALPAILAAIRTGFTLSIVGALVGEIVSGGDQGLGSLVMLAKNQYNTPFMFATLVVLAALAAFYYSATWLLVKTAEWIY